MSGDEEREEKARPFLCFDTETIPQERYLDPASFEGFGGKVALDPRWINDEREMRALEAEHCAEGGTADGNDLIEWTIRTGRARLAATGVAAALHPTTAVLVQGSFARIGKSGEIEIKVVQSDDYADKVKGTGAALAAAAEPFVLADTLAFMAAANNKKPRYLFVSFNGKDFDVPMLRGRALLTGMVAPPWLPWGLLRHPYNDVADVDLRIRLGNGDKKARGTLQWWCDALGVHAEEHGAEVHEWVKAGKWEELREYGHTEGKTLVRLYQLDSRLW